MRLQKIGWLANQEITGRSKKASNRCRTDEGLTLIDEGEAHDTGMIKLLGELGRKAT